MEDSLININEAINDLSALDAENISCCLRLEKCFNSTLKEINGSNCRSVSECNLFSLRDHFYSRLPSLANKITSTFQLVTDNVSGNENGLVQLTEIREAYFKLLATESVHIGCETCDRVHENLQTIFHILQELLSSPKKDDALAALIVTNNNHDQATTEKQQQPRCSSGATDDDDNDYDCMEHQLMTAGLEESAAYPELCTSFALSRYSEISHADDWRFYFEESTARSAKKHLNMSRLSRSRSAEDVLSSSIECRQRHRKTAHQGETPTFPRHLSNDASPVHHNPPESPDRFRWDDYDLKQPLTGNNEMINLNDINKRLSSSSGELANHQQNGQPSNDDKQADGQKGDRPPIKLDGLSAEILSATIRRLRTAEQRVSVLEAYNTQLRDDNHSLVRRLHQSEELVSALREQLLVNTDNTAKQMEDVLSTQLSTLKAERDALVETVERLKPLQIQLAGANFEKRLLQEAMEEESRAAAQWRKDRETLESTLFTTQSLVQRQRLQLAEGERRQNDLSQMLAELTEDKEAITTRLIDSESAASSAQLRIDCLNADLESANKRIEQLRNSLQCRDCELVSERNRLEAEHGRAIDKLRKQLAVELQAKEEQLKREREKEVETLRTQYETRLANLAELSKTMESERTSALFCIKRIHEQELDDIYENHKQELAAVRNEMAEKTEAAVAELREEVEAAHAAELSDLKAKFEEQLREERKQLEDTYVLQIEKHGADHERTLAESIAEYEAKLAAAHEHSRQVEHESNETVEQLGRELETVLANQAQLLTTIADQDSAIQSMRLRLENQDKELESAIIERTGLLTQIEQMRQSLESFTEGEVAAAVATVRSESEIQLEQLSGQLELAKRQLDETHQLLVLAGQHNSDLRSAMDAQQQSHQTQVEQMKACWASESATINQQAVSLKEQLDEIQLKASSLEEAWTTETTELKKQIQVLLEERQKMKPIVETEEASCFAEFEDQTLMELASQNKMLTGQLAVLYDESKRVQDQMIEMHEAELERANFVHVQKMNEIRVALQIQHSDTLAELKQSYETEIQRIKESCWQNEEVPIKGKPVKLDENLIALKEEYEGRVMLLKQEYELEQETAVMKERENLLAEHAITIKQLKADWEIDVKKWQFELETARSSLKTASEERNRLEERLNDYMTQKVDMEAKIREYCTTIEQQRNEFTRKLETEHNDLRSEFENMLQNISSKLEMEAQLKRANFFIDFQQRFDAKVAEMVALREQHVAAMSNAENKIADLQHLIDQFVEEKLELEQKLGRERTDFKQEIERLTTASEENLRTTVRETEERLNESHQAEIKELMQKRDEEHRQEIANLTAKYEGEIHQLSNQLNVKMEMQLNELAKQTAAIDSAVTESYRDKLAAEIAQIERNLSAEFRQREAAAHLEFDQAHEAEILQLEASWRRRCEEFEAQLIAKTEECQRAQEELEQVQETAKRMAELMASDYEQQLKIATETAEMKAKTDAEMELNREKERIQQEAFELRDSVESGLREELDKWRGQTENLEQSIDALQKTLAEVTKARDDAIQTAKLAANEMVVTTGGQSIGIFRLLTCLVQHVHVLINEKTDQLVARPASEGLIEALALVRSAALPSIGLNDDGEDIGRPFQEVQMWVIERMENLLDLVDAALIQSEVDHDFVSQAEKAVQERDSQLSSYQKSIVSAEALIQQKNEELQYKDDEIARLKANSLGLLEAVEKLNVELRDAQHRESTLIDERNVEIEYQRQKLESKFDASVQCDNEVDQVAECEARWAQQAAEMDAAASRAIEDFKQELTSTQQRVDELSTLNERMRIDYEQRLNDSAQHLANKESALKSLRKFLDEQTAEREAEQEEYQKTIVNLQKTLSERLRALEVANNRIAAVDEVQKEMEETSRQLQANQQRMSELQSLLADTEERLRAETGRFQSRLQSTQAEKLRLESDIARARLIISKLEARVGGSCSSTDILDNSVNATFGIDRLQQELVETRNRWEAQSGRLETLESELRQLAEEKRDCVVRMDELRTQLEESQKKLIEAEDACTAALSRFQNDIESRERTIASLQTALTDREIQLQTLETTSRHLLSERDIGGGESVSTPRLNGNISPSFTVNSYGGIFPSVNQDDYATLADREREIEHLRSIIEELTSERNRQIDAAENARRSLECRLTSLEKQLAAQNEEMESRIRNVATVYEGELAALRSGLHNKNNEDVTDADSVKLETEADLADLEGESLAAPPGNLSIIAAELNQEFALSDKLDAALLRRVGIDVNTPTAQPQQTKTSSSSTNGNSYAGLVTPSTSGSSPSGHGNPTSSSSTSPLVAILHRLEDLSSEILRLSDPDTHLLSLSQGSIVTDRLLAVLHKIAPVRSIAVGTEASNIVSTLEEIKGHVATLASRWSSPPEAINEKQEIATCQRRFGEFIVEVSRLLDAAIDQVVLIVVNASSDGKPASPNGNVDAVRQLVHVTTQLSSDFSAAERQALTSDCQVLAQRVRELDVEIAKEKRSLFESNKQLEEFHEKMRLQSGEISHLQSKLEEEQQQRLDAASICQKLKNQLDESYAEIERARRNSDQHYSSVHELEELKRAYDAVVDQVRDKQAELDKFDAKMSGIKQAFTAQLERQQAISTRYSSEAEANREKASRLQCEMTEMKRAVDVAIQERDRLQSEVDRLLGVMADQERRAQEVAEKYTSAEMERCRLMGELETLRDEQTRFEMRVSAKNDATMRQMKESMHKLEQENERLRQESVAVEQRSTCLARDLDRALVASSQSEDRITTLSHQLDNRMAEVSRLSARLTELEASGITQSEFERLKQRLQSRDAACERTIEQTATLRARLAEMTARLSPIRTQMLLAAARANAIAASVSNSAVLETVYSEDKMHSSASGSAVSVAVASQLESGLRMAANELEQLISPVTSTSSGAAVFNPEEALSPPLMYQNTTGNDEEQTQKLLQQNKELGDTVYRLSVELRQLRRNAANDHVSASTVNGPDAPTSSAVAKNNEKNLSVTRQQLREMTAKYVRAEGHRKALVYQKRYLMLVIGDFRDTERQILIKLKAMDTQVDAKAANATANCRLLPKSWHSRATVSLASKSGVALSEPTCNFKLSPLAIFRAAAASVVFMHRTRKLAKKWRRFTANIATQLTENLIRSNGTNNNATPSVMSLFSSAANRRPTPMEQLSAQTTSRSAKQQSNSNPTINNIAKPCMSDLCYTLTTTHGVNPSGYDMTTAIFTESVGNGGAAEPSSGADVVANDDSYLTRLEMVRNQLRECRNASGAAVVSASNFSRR